MLLSPLQSLPIWCVEYRSLVRISFDAFRGRTSLLKATARRLPPCLGTLTASGPSVSLSIGLEESAMLNSYQWLQELLLGLSLQDRFPTGRICSIYSWPLWHVQGWSVEVMLFQCVYFMCFVPVSLSGVCEGDSHDRSAQARV